MIDKRDTSMKISSWIFMILSWAFIVSMLSNWESQIEGSPRDSRCAYAEVSRGKAKNERKLVPSLMNGGLHGKRRRRVLPGEHFLCLNLFRRENFKNLSNLRPHDKTLPVGIQCLDTPFCRQSFL